MSTESTFFLSYSGFLADGLAAPFLSSLQDTVNDHSQGQVRSWRDLAYNTYWLLIALKIKFQVYVHFPLLDLLIIATLSPSCPSNSQPCLTIWGSSTICRVLFVPRVCVLHFFLFPFFSSQSLAPSKSSLDIKSSPTSFLTTLPKPLPRLK